MAGRWGQSSPRLPEEETQWGWQRRRQAPGTPERRENRTKLEWKIGLIFPTFSTSHCFVISCLVSLLQWRMHKWLDVNVKWRLVFRCLLQDAILVTFAWRKTHNGKCSKAPLWAFARQNRPQVLSWRRLYSYCIKVYKYLMSSQREAEWLLWSAATAYLFPASDDKSLTGCLLRQIVTSLHALICLCLLFLFDYVTVGVGYIIGLGCPFVLIRSVSNSENVLWDTPIGLRLH